jgi:hypothetical protein
MQARPPVSNLELRAAWRRLRMVGDFDRYMRRPAIRLVIESAARALARREALPPLLDRKRIASGDTDF